MHNLSNLHYAFLKTFFLQVILVLSMYQTLGYSRNTSSDGSEQVIYILQDVVDNFEHGLFAGGKYVDNGSDNGGFSIVQDQVHTGIYALLFETDEDGFSGPNIEPEDNFISVTKTFSIPIDASSFSHIAYWIKSNNNDPDRFVRMQIVTNENQSWFQMSKIILSDVNKAEFTRVRLPLSGSGFFMPAGATLSDFANITSITFFLVRDNNVIDSDKRSIYLDDIQFLNEPYRLSVKSNPEIGVNVETITAGNSTVSNQTTNFEISDLDDGALVSLEAEAVKNVSGNDYEFSHWNINNENQGFGNNPVSVTMYENTNAIAEYQLNQFSLTVNTETENSVPINDISIDGSLGEIKTPFTTSVRQNNLMELFAEEERTIGGETFHFKQWKINGQNREVRQRSVSFNLIEDTTAIAIYSEGDLLLTVSSISTSGVTIDGTNGGTTDFISTFNNNDNVQLTAPSSFTTGSSTSQFKNWILIKGNNSPEKKEVATLNFNISADSEAIAVYEPTLETLAGWNLVSIPTELNTQANTAITSLSSIYWEWINNSFFLAEEIKPGVGYWFFSKSFSLTSISGTTPGTKSRTLFSGWNLIGVIGSQPINKPVNSTIQGKIWTWDNKQKRYLSIEDNFQPLHKKNKMFPGHGYWIYLDSVSEITLGSE